MIFITWRGKGLWVIFAIAGAMFLPIIVLRKIDGPQIDYGVGIAMGIAAIAIFVLGLRWNRGTPAGSAAPHSFFGMPVQFWALPMMLFAVLLGTRTITTEEAPRQPRQVERGVTQ